MKVSPTRSYEGKTVIQSYRREQLGWDLELVRNMNSKLELIRYCSDRSTLPFIRDFPVNEHIVRPPDEDEVTRHIRFVKFDPHLGWDKYGSVGNLLRRVNALIRRCLDLDDRHRFLLACFVLSSWFVDRLPIAPYVAFVGLPQSGKSTALKILQLLCRRGLITSDISSSAFYRACERFMPTLLIDETATAGQKKALFHLLRSGTTQDAVAFREGKSYRAFGAKVTVWRELPNDEALNSRCIVIPMRETSRTDLLKPTHHEIVKAADKLQRQLMRYKFNKCLTVRLPQISGCDQLRSRDRDVYEALALPIGEDPEASTHLLECMLEERDSNREPLPPNETAVIETLFEQIHLHPDEGTYAIRQLTQEVNSNLAGSAERFRLNARAVGAVLTTLGFRDRKRTSLGWVVWLDRTARKRIHELMSTYGLDAPSAHLPVRGLYAPCDFCKGEDPQCLKTLANDPWASEPPDEDEIVCRDMERETHYRGDGESENDTAEVNDETVAPDAEGKLHHDERSEHNEPKGGTAEQSEFSDKFYEPGDEKLIADIKASLDRGDSEDEDAPDPDPDPEDLT